MLLFPRYEVMPMNNQRSIFLLALGGLALVACTNAPEQPPSSIHQAMYTDAMVVFYDAWTSQPDAAWPVDASGVPGTDGGASGTDGGGGGDGAPVCTTDVIDGLVRQCCTNLGPYGPYTNCTVYSHEFHDLCDATGVSCRSITASCEGETYGHAFNMVQLSDGQWCFVEPQASGGNSVIQPCFNDPESPSPAALCAVMGKPLNADGSCPCTVGQNSPSPLPINTNPVTSCALSPAMLGQSPSFEAFAQCENCCVDNRRYYESVGSDPAECQRWYSDCWYACRNHYHPYYAQ